MSKLKFLRELKEEYLGGCACAMQWSGPKQTKSEYFKAFLKDKKKKKVGIFRISAYGFATI